MSHILVPASKIDCAIPREACWFRMKLWANVKGDQYTITAGEHIHTLEYYDGRHDCFMPYDFEVWQGRPRINIESLRTVAEAAHYLDVLTIRPPGLDWNTWLLSTRAQRASWDYWWEQVTDIGNIDWPGRVEPDRYL